jgi:crotonobetainyl-CoA:carnitine CoA-transferase CaiB-like acyl-CoA transferase
MVEVALNVAAEPVVTYSADGVRLDRQGNRGPGAAPQGIYATAGDEQWVALAVSTDAQWEALVGLVGRPAWSGLGRAERRARHDELDEGLLAWFAGRDRDATVELLLDGGVPAAPVWDQNLQDRLPQLVERGFAQVVVHPIAGEVATPGIGISSDRLDLAYRAAAPTVGQHTEEVLTEVLGLTAEELADLRGQGAI